MSPIPPSLNNVPLPLLVDFHNSHNAEEIYAVPVSPTATGGLVKVTFQDLYKAVMRAAHYLNPLTTGGTPARTGKVIAVLALNDNLIYQTVVMGIVRSGNIALPISNRNSTEGVVNLLRKTECHDIVVGGAAVASLLEDTQAILGTSGYDLNTIDIPQTSYMYPHLGGHGALEQSDDSAYPVPTSIDSANSVLLFIHSSGTTSLPKPIPITGKYLRSLGSSPYVQAAGTTGPFGTMASPPFHMMGFMTQVVTPLSTGSSVALWDITKDNAAPPIPTPWNTLDAIMHAGCPSALVAPSMLVDWAHALDDKALAFLRNMKYVMTGGGPLPGEIGDFLVSQGIHVVSVYGGTEFSLPVEVNRVIGSPEEWMWLEFASQLSLRWVEHVIDSEVFYELQVLENDNFRPAVVNSETPDGPAYSTSDLFIPHPTKKGLWKSVGRLDDQVTLATGEKVNPGPIEMSICESPLVLSAVVFGRARNQIGVIVETQNGFEVDTADDEAVASFRNMLWPTIEAANSRSAGFARIFKEAIIPGVPHKPFPRTPKGSTQRKRTIELYEEEIEKMYSAIEKAKGGDNVVPPVSWTAHGLEPWLKAAVEDLLERHVEADSDIFGQGADSLTATFLRNRIIGVMRKSSDSTVSSMVNAINPDIVFSHPTILSLAAHISSLVGASVTVTVDPVEQQLEVMKTLIQKYTADIPTSPLAGTKEEPFKETVLITGTTGALGSLMLAQLLVDEKIERVFAVNRPSKAKSILERQREAFTDKAIDLSLLEHKKLRLVESDLSANQLGLVDSQYREILSTTTLIIHNAWRLDFNLSVTSFESNICGSRHLVDLALASPHAPSVRFVFISSVGTLLGWNDTAVAVPEEPITDPRISTGNGYAQSKYVTEKILETVAQRTGVATTSIRVGQLSGSSNGFWSTTDWVPIFMATSVHLGCLPDARGVVSWIPLDGAASSLLEVGLARHAPTETVVHLYHPRPVTWSKVVSSAAEALMPLTNRDNAPLPLVPWSEWLAKLESYGPEDVRRIPGLKLLPFYRGLAHGDAQARSLAEPEASHLEAAGFVTIATDKMQALSPTLRGLSPIDHHDPKRWISYWQSKGLFNHLG